MTKAKIAYLFMENQQWFIHEDGVNTPIPAHVAQDLAEEGLSVKETAGKYVL